MNLNKKIIIIFFTFNQPFELKSNSSSLNDKNQEQFFCCEENIDEKTVYINKLELDIDNFKNKKNEISIERKNDYKSKYTNEFGQIENDITFIFDYNIIRNYISVFEDQVNKIIKNPINKFINCFEKYYSKGKFTNSKKFLFFFDYLLKQNNNEFIGNNENNFNNEFIKNDKNIFLSLIRDFIKLNDTKCLSIEVIITIFITSFYEDNFNSFKQLKLKINKKNIDFENKCTINLISSYSEIYLKTMCKCLDKLKKENQENSDLLEIIIIYFIKFKRENINILFDNNNKEMILNVFKRKNTTFIVEKILDEQIIQIFINNSPDIQNILNILNNCENIKTYLDNINKNFESIYNAINSFESFNTLKYDITQFIINCNIRQYDDIEKIVELHNELFKKQNDKKKYFINFNKIIEKYFELYKEYNNIIGLCSLEIMIYEELKYFSTIIQLKKLDEKIMEEIKTKFFNNLNDKALKDEDIIKILLKLKHHYNDGIFKWEEKEKILLFFIDKCKKNDNEILKEYKNGIYKLFSTPDEINKLINILKETEFEFDNKFLDLFPQENINDDILYENISQLIIKVIKDKNKEEIDQIVENENSFFNYFYKQKDPDKLLEKFLCKYLKENNVNIVLNIIIKYNEGSKFKKFDFLINFLNNNFFNKDIFSFKNNNNEEENIPIYILNKISENNEFKKEFINSLVTYKIDEDTIFSDKKNNKFILLEKMIEKNYYLYEYKEQTNKLINEIYNNFDNSKMTNEKLFIIYNNYNVNNNYYDKIKEIIEENKLNRIINYLDKIENAKKYLDNLKIVLKYYETFFLKSKTNEINKVKR